VSSHVSWRPRCRKSRLGFLRSVALRPHLSVSLPFSVASTVSVSLGWSVPLPGTCRRGQPAARRGLRDVSLQGSCRGRRSALEDLELARTFVFWQPRCRRTSSLRPVALRPRLSAGLPLSASAFLAAQRRGRNAYWPQKCDGSHGSAEKQFRNAESSRMGSSRRTSQTVKFLEVLPPV
jgi:hypothetical protein